MGTSTRDIFGDSPRPEPAEPGSYGEAPPGFRLPGETRLGEVHLQVSDLARSVAWYEEVLGLRVLRREAAAAELGSLDDRVLVALHERAGARPAGRRARLGLFHFAILLPDRQSLGAFVRHLGEIGAQAGAGDHLVSEAFYLSDPDGLGIEIYADRPRESWQRVGRELMMATDPVDVRGLVETAAGMPWRGMPEGTVMGHVHLHVGDISLAAAFYSEALGFDRTVWSYPGALFLGAGGYHHHLGTNTWAGPAARAPADGDARLQEWTIELPDDAALAAAERSLERAGHNVDRTRGDGVVIRDPWGIQARIRVTPAGAAAR